MLHDMESPKSSSPRVSVSLSPDMAAVVRRMSSLNGESQSAVIGGLIEAALPVLERMCRVMEAAREAREGVKARVRGSLEDAEAALGSHIEYMLKELHARPSEVVGDILAIRDVTRAGRAGPAQAGRPGADPPHVTRGVQIREGGVVSPRRGASGSGVKRRRRAKI
jgi:hypothetical protein